MTFEINPTRILAGRSSDGLSFFSPTIAQATEGFAAMASSVFSNVLTHRSEPHISVFPLIFFFCYHKLNISSPTNLIYFQINIFSTILLLVEPSSFDFTPFPLYSH